RHFMAARLKQQHALPSALRQALAAGVGLLAHATRHDLVGKLLLSAGARHALRGDRLNRLAQLLATADEDELYRRLTGSSTENLTLHQPPSSNHVEHRLDGLLSRLLYDDMAGYLPGDVLVKLDRASMANSLEGRCPLLDHRVVEFAWRLPTNTKVRNGRGKWILRQLLRRYIPQRLIDRPKQGFDVPIAVWLRGPLRIWASDVLADMRLSGDGIFDFAKVEACWRDHMDGRQDHSRDLWAALMFQAWRNEARRPPAPATNLRRVFELAGV
ncbi:asparagine synthase C-terminal domain-containing protein, partial [Mesorhizobium sp.]|uniref:asparagine synthase C-terminal domain-containing protein n=1 Tax=Mesorhizobium sp. TaxID=1871066 RepID=UPI0025ECBB09